MTEFGTVTDLDPRKVTQQNTIVGAQLVLLKSNFLMIFVNLLAKNVRKQNKIAVAIAILHYV